MDRARSPRERRSSRRRVGLGVLALAFVACEAPPAAPSRALATYELVGPADEPAGEATIRAREGGDLVGALELRDREGERVVLLDDEVSLGTSGIARYSARLERAGLVSRIEVWAGEGELRWRSREGLAIAEGALDVAGPAWVVSEAIEPRMEVPAAALLPWFALAPTLP
ncbi:MAG: hypothetical protein KC420_16430, partial [Myxococcales bacterium]|nr:hypothetical protein [Myxococcales bacterium]